MTESTPYLISCIGVGYDLALLPHFLSHYRDLGVDPKNMILILNAETDDDPALEVADAILSEYGVDRSTRWIAPYTSGGMWQKRAEVQSASCEPDRWVLSADVDEFHQYPLELGEMLDLADAEDANCIQGVFIDRLAAGGALGAVQPTPPVLDQFPLRAEAALSIGGTSPVHGRGGTVKIMAAKAAVLPSRGGHAPLPGQNVRYLYAASLTEFPQVDKAVFRGRVPTQVHHVHWTDTLVGRLEKRLATPGVSPAGKVYGQRQIDHIALHGGISLQKVHVYGDDQPLHWPVALRRLQRAGRWTNRVAPFRALKRKLVG